MSKGIGNQSALQTSCGVTHIPTQREASAVLRKVRAEYQRAQRKHDKLLSVVAQIKVYEGAIASLARFRQGGRFYEFEDEVTPVFSDFQAQFEEKRANRKIPGIKRPTTKRNDHHNY